MRSLFWAISFSFLSSLQASAALDKFTKLDQIGDWVIERKIDSPTKEVFCRASKKGYGTWFSSRIRLNIDNELVVPDQLLSKEKPTESTLKTVRNALKNCRSSIIYYRE